MRESRVDVSVEAHAVLAQGENFTSAEPQEPAVALVIHVLRKVNFPAQAVIQGQARRDAPGILDIEEFAVLPLGSIRGIADITLHGADVAEQERGQWKASPIRSRGLVNSEG